MRQFAISDIHGCLKSFEALLDKIGLSRKDELYLLGDYIDRGPDSKGVIDRIWAMQEQGYAVHCLMGNHEQMMLSSTEDDMWSDTWIFNGGWATLESFSVKTTGEVPKKYLDFLLDLSFFFEVDGYLLVHAGLNFREADPLQDPTSMLWIRDWYGQINHKWLNGRVIVHGHSPIPREMTQQQLERLDQQAVLNIDSGCVFNKGSQDIGYLCAFDMSNRKLYFQKNIEVS